jgi:hypothetical protein
MLAGTNGMGQVIDQTAALVAKFPLRGDELRKLYMASEGFRDLVRDFNDASRALAFWASSHNTFRQQEYRETLAELEIAILQMLAQSS